MSTVSLVLIQGSADSGWKPVLFSSTEQDLVSFEFFEWRTTERWEIEGCVNLRTEIVRCHAPAWLFCKPAQLDANIPDRETAEGWMYGDPMIIPPKPEDWPY